MTDRDYTGEIAQRLNDVRDRRADIVRALEQQVPEAVIVACLVDAIVRERAPLEVRLQFAAGINYEVQKIAAEWRGSGPSAPGWASM